MRFEMALQTANSPGGTQLASKRSRASTRISTPVRIGSTHGNCKRSVVRRRVSVASLSERDEVLRATPTKRGLGFVNRATDRYPAIACSKETTGKCAKEAKLLRARS